MIAGIRYWPCHAAQIGRGDSSWRRVILTGSGDASPAQVGSATGNWSRTGRDSQIQQGSQTARYSSRTPWGAQPGPTRTGQPPQRTPWGPRSRAAAAKPSASRRTLPPGNWAPCRPPCCGHPPCHGRTPAAQSRRRPRQRRGRPRHKQPFLSGSWSPRVGS